MGSSSCTVMTRCMANEKGKRMAFNIVLRDQIIRVIWSGSSTLFLRFFSRGKGLTTGCRESAVLMDRQRGIVPMVPRRTHGGGQIGLYSRDWLRPRIDRGLFRACHRRYTVLSVCKY